MGIRDSPASGKMCREVAADAFYLLQHANGVYCTYCWVPKSGAAALTRRHAAIQIGTPRTIATNIGFYAILLSSSIVLVY